ncbi:hypothetical protein [Staphylococcus aureus]|nr:hypothetical protein [Staphylococcus aureus]
MIKQTIFKWQIEKLLDKTIFLNYQLKYLKILMVNVKYQYK